MSVTRYIEAHICGIVEVPFGNPFGYHGVLGKVNRVNHSLHGIDHLDRIHRGVFDFVDIFDANLFHGPVTAVALARNKDIKANRKLAAHLDHLAGIVLEGSDNLAVDPEHDNLAGAFHTHVGQSLLFDMFVGLELVPIAVAVIAPRIHDSATFNLDHPGGTVAIDAGRCNRIGRIVFDLHVSINRKIVTLQSRIYIDRHSRIRSRTGKIPRFHNRTPVLGEVRLGICDIHADHVLFFAHGTRQ